MAKVKLNAEAADVPKPHYAGRQGMAYTKKG